MRVLKENARLCHSFIQRYSIKSHSPNTKPWITIYIKSLMIERNEASHAGHLERKHDLQKQIKCEIWRAKNKYKEKVEGDL